MKIDDIRTDFDNLKDGQVITLHPNDDNPISKNKQIVTYSGGYFWNQDFDIDGGPEYYLGDVLKYCHGFTINSIERNHE